MRRIKNFASYLNVSPCLGAERKSTEGVYLRVALATGGMNGSVERVALITFLRCKIRGFPRRRNARDAKGRDRR